MSELVGPSSIGYAPPRERVSDRAFAAVAVVVLLLAAAVGTAGLTYGANSAGDPVSASDVQVTLIPWYALEVDVSPA